MLISFLRYLFILSVAVGIYSCSRPLPELTTAEQLMETAPDSALHILQRFQSKKVNDSYNRAFYALLMSQALDKNDIKEESDSLISIATDYFDNTEPIHAGYAWFYHARTANNRDSVNEQARNLLKAQEYAEKTTNNKLLGLINYDKAIMYFNQRQYNTSVLYFKTASNYFNHLKDKKNFILSVLYTGYSYLYLSKVDSAQIYYKQAEKVASTTNNNILLSIILRNIGTVYFQKGNYNEALKYFHKVPITGNKIYDSNKYYLIADIQIKKNQLDSAKYYLNRINDLTEIAPDYYRLWQAISEKEKNKTKALYFANKVNFVTDSIYKRKLEVSFAGLELKYKNQGLKLINQNLSIKNKQRGFLLVLSLLCLTIFFVVFLIWRLRVKRNEVEYQRTLVEKEKELVEKEKEKTAREKENNALLEKQLKLQSILLLNLEHHRKNSAKQTGLWKKRKNETNPSQNKTFNDELIACMDLEYDNISRRLKEKHPILSANDILTCCLILAGFETGMIATVFDVQNDSVFIRRSRIRKKLELDESINLDQFLRAF